jgi:hypothetical protein
MQGTGTCNCLHAGGKHQLPSLQRELHLLFHVCSTGNQTELEIDFARLQSTLANLTATNAAAAVALLTASDKGGRLLHLILEWRQHT